MTAAIPFRQNWQPADSLPDMDEQEFGRWAALLEDRTGMFMPPERRSFLVTGVGLRMREAGFTNHEDYYRHLNSGVSGNLEWAALVDRLTVHETHFFRDRRALDFLREQAIPELLAARRQQDALHLWSAGCATGEEVYTLAMLVDRYLDASGDPRPWGITGTDISFASLAAARAGIYSQRRCGELSADHLERYFQELDQGRFQVLPFLRRHACFAHLNMIEVGRLASQQADVIYCQNLLIYFSRARRLDIVNGLVHHLRPGGLLVLGAGELVHWRHSEMQRLHNRWDVLAYRRRDN
ncbi:MAG: protein-glutamate O-methyltransferase CheR [Ectothiorhodospiraceae bacterium]|nr:protein-glutamate O-methyltransferase CheR [Ectothiorhodospiraceae bacterium]